MSAFITDRAVARVLITFAPPERPGFPPCPDYPLVVRCLNAAGQVLSGDVKVRSVRDGRLYGNGICHGLMVAGSDRAPANPELDPRLADV